MREIKSRDMCIGWAFFRLQKLLNADIDTAESLETKSVWGKVGDWSFDRVHKAAWGLDNSRVVSGGIIVCNWGWGGRWGHDHSASASCRQLCWLTNDAECQRRHCVGVQLRCWVVKGEWTLWNLEWAKDFFPIVPPGSWELRFVAWPQTLQPIRRPDLAVELKPGYCHQPKIGTHAIEVLLNAQNTHTSPQRSHSFETTISRGIWLHVRTLYLAMDPILVTVSWQTWLCIPQSGVQISGCPGNLADLYLLDN